MQIRDRGNFLFWTFMVLLYVLSIGLSYRRVYITENYPIFYSEEELPDPLDDLKHFLKLDTL
jgi:hypothetical protein